MDNPESKVGGKLHLEMEGTVKSLCQGHQYKKRGRFRATCIGTPLSLFLDEETEDQRGQRVTRGQTAARKRQSPVVCLSPSLLDSSLCAKRGKKIHFGNSIHQRMRIFKYFDISSGGFCLLQLLCHPLPSNHRPAFHHPLSPCLLGLAASGNLPFPLFLMVSLTQGFSNKTN